MDLIGAGLEDPVSEAIASLEVRSSVFCVSELGSPWGFRVDGGGAKFHLVLAGQAILEVQGSAPIRLSTGDLVVLLHGEPHALYDADGSSVVTLESILAGHPLDDSLRLTYGGSGPVTRILCGGFVLGDRMPGSVIDLLPDHFVVDAASVAATSWLEPMLMSLASGVGGDQGAVAVQSKIADVFVAQAVRAWLVGARESGTAVAALLNDPPIAEAVTIMRSSPGKQWTMDLIASSVGLSRTSFFTRFKRAVGESPSTHLTKLRINNAAGLLATTTKSTREIARLCGYDTEASLSKAFRREIGVAPGAYRTGSRRFAVTDIAGRTS